MDDNKCFVCEIPVGPEQDFCSTLCRTLWRAGQARSIRYEDVVDDQW